MEDEINPKAFISYSWDDEVHKAWVRELAARLRADGVNVTLDQWETAPGDQLPAFMERAIRESEYVLIVCTPRYKERSEGRKGGVGYEGDIMTAEVFTTQNDNKFIPILRRGTWRQAAPSWLSGKIYIDLSGNPYPERGYEDLIATIYRARPAAPALGPIPERFRRPSEEGCTAGAYPVDAVDDVKVKGIIVDEVTVPRMDDTRGSALYRIPFQLSRTPSVEWATLFVEIWDHPPSWTLGHRRGIASVRGDRVVLDGTTIEEVEKYHRDMLVLVVEQVNQLMAEREAQRREEEDLRMRRLEEHRKHIEDLSTRIKFD